MASLETVPFSGSVIQAVSYGSGIFSTKAVVLQEVSYDLPGFDAVLIEDADGIVPDGGITCDRTPTVTWPAAVGGVPPYRYFWSVRTHPGLSFAASGITLDLTQVETPALPFGIYQFDLTAEDNTGSRQAYSPLFFWVRDCRRDLPIRAIRVPPIDLEKVVPDDDDYIRYLPQWMAVHGTTTAAASASTLFQLLASPLRQFRKVTGASAELLDQAALSAVPIRLPRLAWRLQTRHSARETLTATVQASGIVQPIRRSGTQFDFLTADDPVFLIDDTGLMVFRNLAQREVDVASTGPSGDLLYQFVIRDEAQGIRADTDVFFDFGGIRYRIKAGSPGIDPVQAAVQLLPPFSGTIHFRYSSVSREPLVQVSVSGDVYRAPDTVDLWNRFDELALITGLARYPDEDNQAFRDRIQARLLSVPGVTAALVAQHTAQDLRLVRILPWDGRETLDVGALEIHGARRFDVNGLPEIGTISEELLPFPGAPNGEATLWSGSKTDWLPGWEIRVGGIPVTPLRYPNLAVSGSVVNFGISVSGQVVATYRYPRYTRTLTAQGFIAAVIPNADNLPSGSYTAVFTQNVRVFTITDPGFIAADLLHPDGTPNGRFDALRDRLMEGSPLHFSRARWGPDAHWFEQSDQQPEIRHLPAVFDLF